MKRLMLLLLFMASMISEVSSQGIKTVSVDKPGKLKSVLKNDMNISELSVNGSINEKDLKFLSTLPNLKSLDLRESKVNAIFDPQLVPNIAALYLPKYGRGDGVLATINSCPNIEVLGLGHYENQIEIPNIPNLKKVIVYESVLSYTTAPVSSVSQRIDTIRLEGNYFPKERVDKEYGFSPKIIQNKKGINFLNKWSSMEEIKGAEAIMPSRSIIKCTGSLSLDNTIYTTKAFQKSEMTELILSKAKEIGAFSFSNCSNLKKVVIKASCGKVHIREYAFSDCTNLESIIIEAPVEVDESGLVIDNNEKYTVKEIVFKSDATLHDKSIGKTANIVFEEVPMLSEDFAKSNKYSSSSEKINLYNTIRVPDGSIDIFLNYGIDSNALYEAGESLDLSITLEKGGTILSKLPIDKLNLVKSLKVIGILYETDLKIIAKCKNLVKLDLSQAYTTLSPQMAKQKRANAEFLAGMFELMGAVADDKHKDYEMSTIEHDQVKMMSELLKSAVDVKKGEVGCIISKNCINELLSLETLILPYRLTRIEDNNFHNCPYLKNIEFPPYIEAMGDNVFTDCTRLEEIKLPSSFGELTNNSMTYGTIGTFNGCKSLKKVDMSLCTFRNTDYRKVFYDCNDLKELRLPRNITKISYINNEKGLNLYIPKSVMYINTSLQNMTVHFMSETAPSLYSCVIKNCTIYIPKGCMTDYYSNYGDSNKYIEE